MISPFVVAILALSLYNLAVNSLLTRNGLASRRSSTWNAIGRTNAVFGLHSKLHDNDEIEVQAAHVMVFTLLEHTPLGCTVEESLAPFTFEEGEDPYYPVFIAKLTEGGNAAKAGLQVGDVILGLTGVFDQLQDVSRAGIDKVKGLVSSRGADQELVIKVVRGTQLKEDHENALLDMCTLDGNDLEMNQCLDSIMGSAFISDQNEKSIESVSAEQDLIDSMYEKLWDEETEFIPDIEDIGVPPKPQETVIQRAPWSSRSSPSGTFVRNPKTGKLENIDQ